MSRKRRRRKRGRSPRHDPDEAAEEERQEQPAETGDRPSSEGAEESAVGSGIDDEKGPEEQGSEGQSAELGIAVPETRQGEVDPVRIAEALHEMSKVNLDYQRRRLAEGRGIEHFERNPEIVASIAREEEALGMQDAVTGRRREPHRIETRQTFAMEWWDDLLRKMAVTYREAVSMSRKAVEGPVPGGAVEGLEDAPDDGGEPEAEADDPSGEAAGTHGAGPADGGADAEGGVDRDRDPSASAVGDGPKESGPGRPDEPAATASEKGPGATSDERQTADGADGGGRRPEAGGHEAAIAEVKRSVEGLAEGMKESVRGEIALRMDALAEENRESGNTMLRTLDERMKGLEALIPAFEKGEVAGLAASARALEKSVAKLSGKLPAVRKGDVPKLIGTLEDFSERLNTHASDFNWAREMEKDRGAWRRWAAAGVAVPVLVAAGLFGQQQFDVVPDGTNGWKTLVWETHGIEVAKCMRQAARSGNPVNCPLRIGPR